MSYHRCEKEKLTSTTSWGCAGEHERKDTDNPYERSSTTFILIRFYVHFALEQMMVSLLGVMAGGVASEHRRAGCTCSLRRRLPYRVWQSWQRGELNHDRRIPDAPILFISVCASCILPSCGAFWARSRQHPHPSYRAQQMLGGERWTA